MGLGLPLRRHYVMTPHRYDVVLCRLTTDLKQQRPPTFCENRGTQPIPFLRTFKEESDVSILQSDFPVFQISLCRNSILLIPYTPPPKTKRVKRLQRKEDGEDLCLPRLFNPSDSALRSDALKAARVEHLLQLQFHRGWVQSGDVLRCRTESGMIRS